MEVSFVEEIKSLRLGEGETFHGEGILAVTKALLQSGVAYVGGYQGAPVSHLLDVMVQAKPLMQELGVHVEACSNEASAAAMLGASIHYRLRVCVGVRRQPRTVPRGQCIHRAFARWLGRCYRVGLWRLCRYLWLIGGDSCYLLFCGLP